MSLGITAAGWAAIGAVGGGLIAANASSNAADTQAAASDRAAQISDDQFKLTRADQLKQYDQSRQDLLDANAQNRTDILAQLAQTRSDQAPYREAGTKSLAELMAGSAPGGDFTKNYERTGFEVDPGYQFRVQQGEQGIERAAAAGGGRYSGATLKALARFNSGIASQEYGNYDARQNVRENQFNINRDFRRNNLATLAGVGQTATRDVNAAGSNATSGLTGSTSGTAAGLVGSGTSLQSLLGQLGAGNATYQGNALQSSAAARASGYVGGANAVTGAIGQGLGYYQNNNLLQMLQRGSSTSPPSTNYGSLVDLYSTPSSESLIF